MFDLDTYLGRISHFNKLTSIRQIFLSKMDLIECQMKIESFKLNPNEWGALFLNFSRIR